jgi:NADH-quinone oxidoreductase subunit M
MVPGYMVMLLLLQTGMMGTFVALDMFLFYVFWEIMLLPMYFLIGIWGGPRKEYAAIKFFLYTLAGSVLMLVAIIGLYYTSAGSIDGMATAHLQPARARGAGPGRGSWRRRRSSGCLPRSCSSRSSGFAIKIDVPLPPGCPRPRQSPAISVIWPASLKMGPYGILR